MIQPSRIECLTAGHFTFFSQKRLVDGYDFEYHLRPYLVHPVYSDRWIPRMLTRCHVRSALIMFIAIPLCAGLVLAQQSASNEWPIAPVSVANNQSLQPLPDMDATNGAKKDDTAQPEDRKDDDKDRKEPFKEQKFNIFGQATVITQWHEPFRSLYVGPHSLLPLRETDTSMTGTLFIGARICDCGELYFDPEIAGGEGFSQVFGLAGFPNGEITRVGSPEPTPYIARFYYVQTFGLGGETENIEAGQNQLAITKDISRISLVLGKYAASDFFDNNKYSHDPRSQFMNWSIMDNGAWDYPADVRGYTYGWHVEWNEKNWAVRYGFFGMPTVANGAIIDPRIDKAHGQIVEIEQRYHLFFNDDQPGKIRYMIYRNNANMGNYRQATDDPALNLDIAQTASYANAKFGLGVNFEQQFSEDLGGFLRCGWNDGKNESFAFTEIDQTVSFGLVKKGKCWCRPEDELGLACAVNGISGDHRDYLAAGGLGFILGDGALRYGPEAILETYYRFKFKDKQIFIMPDFQLVGDPGYNRDRGPVGVGTIRVHAEF